MDTYSASIDVYESISTLMTTAGVTANLLDNIEYANLTPGEPSPIGRCPNTGELAYPIYAHTDYVSMSRTEAAALLHLLARAMPDMDADGHPARGLHSRLMACAAPREIHDNDTGTGHAQMAYLLLQQNIRETGMAPLHDAPPPWLALCADPSNQAARDNTNDPP